MSEVGKHSSLPFRAEVAHKEYSKEMVIRDDNNKVIAIVSRANAEFITRVCNSHDALAVALEETIAALNVCCITLSDRAVVSVESIVTKARAILEQAQKSKEKGDKQ